MPQRRRITSDQWQTKWYLLLPSLVLCINRIGPSTGLLSSRVILWLSGIADWGVGIPDGQLFRAALSAHCYHSILILVWPYLVLGRKTSTHNHTLEGIAQIRWFWRQRNVKLSVMGFFFNNPDITVMHYMKATNQPCYWHIWEWGRNINWDKDSGYGEMNVLDCLLHLLVTIYTHDFIVLPNAPWPDIPFCHNILILSKVLGLPY